MAEGIVAMSSRAGAGLPERRERLARLRADRELLAREHPYLEYSLDERRVVGCARGEVPLLLPDGQIDSIDIEVDFHHGYVPGLPGVYDARHRWVSDDDRHIPWDHSFCMYLRGVDEPNLSRPSALRSFMLDVICFLEQQLIYDRVGRFPGPQWPHKRDAYARYIVEELGAEPRPAAARLWNAIRTGPSSRNEPCPCGSGMKCKRCHLDLVSALARIAARHGLRGYDYPSLTRFAGVAA
jgi:hypothetical protein